ncbi:MAG: penicillin-binding protein 2 [Betaproteobacteria bacterium]|jgi:cell division protein FtsI (penicillin-binding protein 3)|nr:penicillin-binding protein 2 [Nitrosomonadales bacterium]NCX68472.1 penicillin-binding protein 2 [Betaproteobacteria bacterium]
MKKFSHQSDIFELSKNRRRVVLSLLLLLFLMLFSRALYLQQIKKDFLQNKGDGFSVRNEILHSYRGKIYDRNNKLLAVSSPTYDIGLSISNNITNENIRDIATILKINEKNLRQKIKNKNKGFIYIKRSVSPESAKKISELKIAGLNLDKQYRRFYPNRESAAHIIGKTNLDGIGHEGLEKQWDSILTGEKGHKKVVIDGGRRIIDDLHDFKLPKNGSDVFTTIDSRLQHTAYESLKKYIERYEAKSGSAVLIDAKNGDILVMTNYPSYNPNASVTNLDAMRNRSVTDTFEPGSTLKPISVAYALEKKKVGINEIINTNNGLLKVGQTYIRDDHPENELTIKDVIKTSSNVGAAIIGTRLSPKELWGAYDKLGFGKKIHSQIPGEVTGKLRTYTSWRDIDHSRMPYGYGVSVNLLQLTQAYTIFANDGVVLKPKLYTSEEIKVGEKVISQNVAKKMRSFMQSVVEEDGGTGGKAKIPGYTVAGKTGTAKKVINGQYVNQYVASFVGIAPSNNPKFILAVMIDDPSKDSYYGGTVAAPVFKDIMKDALKLYDVPYDKELNENLMNNMVKPQTGDAKL